MKTKLLTLMFFLTVVFGFSQTETISINWIFLAVPADDPDYGDDTINDTNITIEEGVQLNGYGKVLIIM